MSKKKRIIVSACGFSIAFSLLYGLLFYYCGKESGSSTLYLLQVGIYQQKENVDEMIAKLKKDGFESFAYQQDQTTILFCGITNDEAKLNLIGDRLKSKNYSFLIKKITFQDRELSDLVNRKDYQGVLKRIKYETKADE